MAQTFDPNMTLLQVLDSLGYEVRAEYSRHQYGKRLIKHGMVVFDGDADMTWRWLRIMHPDFFVTETQDR